jgi:hypothetical protein
LLNVSIDKISYFNEKHLMQHRIFNALVRVSRTNFSCYG